MLILSPYCLVANSVHFLIPTYYNEVGDKPSPEVKTKSPSPGHHDKAILDILQPAAAGGGDFVTAADVVKLLSEKGVQLTAAQVGLTLKRLGFQRKAKRVDGISKRGFFVIFGEK